MLFTAHKERAQATFGEVNQLSLVNLGITTFCFVCGLLGFFYVSTSALVIFGLLALMNGGYFLHTQKQISEAEAQDEAEKLEAIAAEMAQREAARVAMENKKSPFSALFGPKGPQAK
jgi:hypothetical protein